MSYTKEQQNKIKELESEMKGKYLTEEYLGKILSVLYPNDTWIHDKEVQVKAGSTSRKFRPDYCCNKLCVEFDGPDHYKKADIIYADEIKDKFLKEQGYDVIRVPYFIQLDTTGIKYLFGLDVDFNYGFKHGFISRNVTLPASFCEQGVWKFNNFIINLKIKETREASKIFEEIKESLLNKIEKYNKMSPERAKLQVVPSHSFLMLGLIGANHDSIDNMNRVKSTLENNWNCTILESAQLILDQDGIYNMKYTYNSDGNISGYSFNMIYKGEVSQYTLLVDKVHESNEYEEEYASISVHENGNMIFQEEFELSDINLFNLSDFALALF